MSSNNKPEDHLWDAADELHSDAVAPAWSPDGRRIAYWAVRGGQRDIYTVSAEGGDLVRITSDIHTDWNPVWGADSASILFVSDRGGQPGLWSIALDESGRPAGDPRPVMRSPSFISQAALAADGRTLLIDSQHARHLVKRVGFDMARERFAGMPETIHVASAIGFLSVSGDGEWIAYHSAPPDEDITIVRTDGTERRRLTRGLSKDRGPQWSPDGEKLSYYSNRNGDYELWEVSRSSAEARVIPIPGVSSLTRPLFSPDGTKLVVGGAIDGETGRLGLFKVGPDGSFELERRLDEALLFARGWSPDGRRVYGRAQGLGLVAYDLSTDDLVPIRNPDGESASGLLDAVWLDPSRIMTWQFASRRIFVFDIGTGESRWVENVDESWVDLHGLIDGDTLYYSYREADADLWLVTLGETAAAP